MRRGWGTRRVANAKSRCRARLTSGGGRGIPGRTYTAGMEHCDVAIIGGGQAGVPLAHALPGAGKRVLLAERKHLGGSCLNFGCTPTKAAITSARLAHLARRGADFGLRIPTVEVDFGAVIQRARNIVDAQRAATERGFAGKE